ncbi:hypothetical protein ZIOFF_075658 [Zingiber officinale]|uniref:non-specific serine/threonine protein kinase n=1 Tax=Zingiber officinale TaxID=94328 RepID=A0A8J5ERD8_ZINOF|nr:hypothetical protein ZIOFF_075658 [Zingiber officinale]
MRRKSGSSNPSRNSTASSGHRASFESTPDRWATERSSAASFASPFATPGRGTTAAKRKNPMKELIRAIISFFSSSTTDAASSSGKFSRSLGSPYVTPVHRLHGNLRRYQGSDSPWRKESGTAKFTMEEILKATKNFSPMLRIGQGGFGIVYKGMLDDGTLIAVKRAKKTISNSHLSVEFRSEIKILGQVEHLNLVRYFGYLEENDERVVIIEYVPNGTLRQHLDGIQGNYLDLASRLDIAVDVTHAVTYLHMYADHPIIHRDIKSSNILLTDNLRAKVSDFGFARLGVNEAGVTHISTQVKGTAGYLDPEYLRTFHLTDRSDVFSFGVLLVELISARHPIERNRDLRERAMKKFRGGKAIEILDPVLPRTPANTLAVEKILELASRCLAPARQNRPAMKSCGEMLWNIRKDYRELLSTDSLQRSPSVTEVAAAYHGTFLEIAGNIAPPLAIKS